MHILQFNYRVKFKGVSSHLLKLLLSLLITVSSVFHPSLSVAQPQGAIADKALKLNDVTLCTQDCIVTRHTRPGKLLVMGDSLSAAYGLDIEKGWVALLQGRYPNVDVINASISGETTSGGKQRLPKLLEQHQPDIMILELGANDALRGQNLKVTQANLQSMIGACSSFNKACKVILLGVQLPTNYGPLYDKMFQKMYQDLTRQNNLLFDPFFIEPVALDPDLMQEDGLHPNADGQPLILHRLIPLIEKAVWSE